MPQYFDNYSPVGDLAVVAICVVLLVLMRVAYIVKTKYYQIFRLIVILLTFSALANVAFHHLTLHGSLTHPFLIYLFRFAYNIIMYAVLNLYILYSIVLLSLTPKKDMKPLLVAAVGTVVLGFVDLFATIFKFGFYIDKGVIHDEGDYLFSVIYIYLVSIIVYNLFKFRNMIYKRVIAGVSISVGISFIMMTIMQICRQNSYVTVTFLFPTISIFYLIHANPYDLSIGAVNRSGFEDMIKTYHEKGRHLIMMSLFIPEYSGEGKKYPESLRVLIRDFSGNSFNGAVLFQVENGHMILSAPLSSNPNYEQIINRLLNKFNELYPRYKKDYKIVITDSIDEVSRNNEYIELLRFVHSIMAINTVRKIQVEDIESFRNHKFIVEQLEDICKTKDLRDDRVAVFCQPVFNLSTRSYDTAEALMRLKLPHIGLVFPDQFIPVAEERGLIHTLSLIIFSKTCQQIRNLIVGGYYVRRISVNFAVTELRDDGFCDDINRVIAESGIPSDKVAIEITESQNEADFNVIKSRIEELHDSGIKFYLDDFGTGYSNIERIMELPFDIIKFDRSLVMASAADTKSEMMVGSLASMFAKMEYSVLYEGVETEQDERKCIRMDATYLQGYKYSRPIPIERLTEFFVRNGKKSGKEPDIDTPEELVKTSLDGTKLHELPLDTEDSLSNEDLAKQAEAEFSNREDSKEETEISDQDDLKEEAEVADPENENAVKEESESENTENSKEENTIKEKSGNVFRENEKETAEEDSTVSEDDDFIFSN